jgi:adenylate cyclase
VYERERKFLVKELPADLSRYSHRLIEQGYVTTPTAGGQAVEVRLRRVGARTVLTVKEGRGARRVEREVPVSPTAARVLWPLTRGRRIEKMRYKIPYRGHTIELDVYRGNARGLIVAEVEFRSDGAMRRFVAPPWLGRDVTGRTEFANSRLAVAGWKGRRRRSQG